MINVLLTGVGGPTPKAIASSLKKHSNHGPYFIVGTDCNPLARGLYEKEYIDKSYLVPAVKSDSYWSQIINIVRENKIDVAIVQPEVEVEGWAKKSEQEELPCPVLLPPYKLIKILRDKSRMNDLLEDTNYIPHSVKVDHNYKDLDLIGEKLEYPYWIRGSKGSSGIGALKINSTEEVKAWLNISPDIEEFTASTFLPGRNLACKCLYFNGDLIKAACAERVNYVMAKVAPSGITGNTSFGRLLNYEKAVEITTSSIKHICNKLNIVPHGFLTADLKEDKEGKPKITEINIRHVAFTSSFAAAGANLAEDMLQLTLGNEKNIRDKGVFKFEEGLIFLRDVDSEPIVMKESELLK